MRSRRGRQRRLIQPGELVAWDPSDAHTGSAANGQPWWARLIVVEVADLAALAGDHEHLLPADIAFPNPVVSDRALAAAFVQLHTALEGSSTRLERDEQLAGWLHLLVERSSAIRPHRGPLSARDDRALREVLAGLPARFHHISHGTLGIVLALAAVGRAAGRTDLVELALAGAADVVARNEGGPEGFLVPHSDPQHMPELTERYSYGWCHGPAGDAQVFRLLAAVTGDPAWPALVDRCWQTVINSGLPRRLRPGFWDNSARCCGTAGVLALACDRYVEGGDGLDFANLLVEDLAERAMVDADGVRWSNYEHRSTPSGLEARTGWGMGNAGIIRELLRFSRASTGRDPAYGVAWPDHLPAHPI